MIASNNRISLRQMERLLTFDLLGVSTLVVPSILAKNTMGLGVVSIGLAFVLANLYLLIIVKVIGKASGNIINSKLLCGYLSIFSISLAAFCLRIFARLIINNLVYKKDLLIILLVIMVGVVYSISGGIESRARCYEVLFWFVIIPLLLMMAFAVKDIKIEYLWAGMKAGYENLDFKKVVNGAFLVFSMYSTLFYLLFLTDFLEEADKKKVGLHIEKSLAISSVILLFLYVILLGVFGYKSLATMEYPVVTLMSTIQIKGSFLKRMDAFMLGIWFFTLFACVNLFTFYGASIGRKMLDKCTGKRCIGKKKIRLTDVLISSFLVIVLTIVFDYSQGAVELYMNYIKKIGIPVLIIIPVVLLVIGCGATALENRCFPMMMTLDMKEDGTVLFSYDFPKTGIKSNEGQDNADISLKPQKGANYELAREKYEEKLCKKADNNHLKIILIGETFVQNEEQMKAMVEKLRETENIPRNSYVCITEDVNEIIELEELQTMDLGSYIEEYLENNNSEKKQTLVTLGDVIDEIQNCNRTLRIPYLEVDNEDIIWKTDYIMEKGQTIGIVI